MVNRKAKKSSPARSSTAAGAAAAAARVAKAETQRAQLLEWLDANDPLYDRSGAPPLTISEVLSTKLAHKTFTKADVGERPYDWSKLRAVLEARTASSPRWFMQIREEDLLVEGGLDGVTVDCVVIAEASQPTLAPAHYIVKQHLPFSDLEDNAPERILPIEGQNMYWKRVVRDDGANINTFLLQKRDPASSAQFGFSGATASSGESSKAPVATGGFDFGFGNAQASSNGNSGANVTGSGGVTIAFGFGTAVPTANSSSSTTVAPASGFNFGFGAAPVVDSNNAVSGNGSNSSNNVFGFGSAVNNNKNASNSTGSGHSQQGRDFEQVVSPLKANEVLFALWSTKRLMEMSKSLKSGSRVVREGFKPNPGASPIKLVIQNDLKDDIAQTVRQLVLNRLFAKRSSKVKAVDHWIDACPVYEDHLAAAMQKFRENYVKEVAESSDEFHDLYKEYHEPMEAELRRIVEGRKAVITRELKQAGDIMQLIKEKKIAEKQTFRLLKYYAANDVMKFRPFGKVSGISEMGESADVCEPPAPVIVNPFMTMQSKP
ncbi:hypothetical protein, conserved [Trypanosoma brucei gambiense DAL972]|uniref:Nucleoporin n=1 Tax=Trypanosoma brucei gambiense (strain MHOM/CI/86/DAL972) TaxID=679716 RepID=D0A676_TRYB9|nr:hypothetical protein, conserved [Trypanosoma brucei gambiense DAL972]CBH17177.1 hypothetical protein, conserved [Trypanosoma brucei gambiense DAL972]|eukprot:XP_011779441.1 hypothetical protein, conserved [Trypanosoma brucei gambiense DAL972]